MWVRCASQSSGLLIWPSSFPTPTFIMCVSQINSQARVDKRQTQPLGQGKAAKDAWILPSWLGSSEHIHPEHLTIACLHCSKRMQCLRAFMYNLTDSHSAYEDKEPLAISAHSMAKCIMFLSFRDALKVLEVTRSGEVGETL